MARIKSDIAHLDSLCLDRPIKSLQSSGIVSINQQVPAGTLDKICVRVAVFDEGKHSEDYSKLEKGRREIINSKLTPREIDNILLFVHKEKLLNYPQGKVMIT